MNILLVSHGDLCHGMASAFRMFAPTAGNVHALGLTDEGGVESFRAQLDALLDRLLAEGDVLVMADLKGGTPFNESYARLLANPEHIGLVAGLNLPMLVETGVLAATGAGLDVLCAVALEAGRAGVEGAEPPEEGSDEEDLF